MTDGQSEITEEITEEIMYEPTNHDRHTQDAHRAGECSLPACEPDKCMSCSDHLHGPYCQLCRDNPDADPNLEIRRLAVWLRRAVTVIENADYSRRQAGATVSQKEFQEEIKQALSDFNDDGERLVSLLWQPDAEEVAGELGVATIIEEGER